MKKILYTLVICSGTTLGIGQTVTPTVMASAGGFGTSAQGSVAWTIGEPVSATFGSASNITTVGFLQPEMELITLIRDQEMNSGLLVFPNPVKDELNINFNGMAQGKYHLELNDAAGRLIYQGDADVKAGAEKHNIRLDELAAGAYFLNIKGQELVKTVKINKVN